MKLLIENRRCVIQAYELDDNIYNIDDRASMLYFHLGVEFEEGMVYQGVKYFFHKKEIRFSYTSEVMKDEIVTIQPSPKKKYLKFSKYGKLTNEL